MKQVSTSVVGFPGGAVVKKPPATAGAAGDLGSPPGPGDPPEEEMATHSSVIARIIPWTEKPGELQSTGSQKVRHVCAATQQAFFI